MAFRPAMFCDEDVDRVIEIVRPLRMDDRKDAQGPLVLHGPAGMVPVQILHN